MTKKKTYIERYDNLSNVKKRLEAKQTTLLQKSLSSNNISELLEANKKVANLQSYQSIDRKSYLIDPNQFASYMGYKDKPYSLSYQILRRMARNTMVVNSVVKTRQDQILNFCEPQKDKYSTGFCIRKKKGLFENEGIKENKEEQKRIEFLTNFILNCGSINAFEADDFASFTKKVIWDGLVFDQMNFEIVNDRRGFPVEFLAVDPSTIRLSDSIDKQDFNRYKMEAPVVYNRQDNTNMTANNKQSHGYYPAYVQILQGGIVSEFYPWEMCFGVRNPTTNIYLNGYGVSELEDLITTVTSMLWAEEYNRRFFSQGSAPKGLIKVKNGQANSPALQQFKQQWLSMITGVTNAWRTPVLEGDIEWIDLQKNNVDMQFNSYQEFLIKITCAVYRIDPAEINFPLSGGSDQKALFEGNNEARLKHSRDKGLYPLLRFYQSKINKYLISRLDPKYEFVFCGMDEMSVSDELDQDIKKIGSFMTINEIRARRGLKAVEGGDIIANPIFFQSQMQKMQMEMYGGNSQGATGGEEGENEGEEEEKENPFEKALNSYLSKLQAA